jgi:hypothetical protein
MNTNGLAKQYDKLTPLERLPLIMAAAARGDEAERNRLVQSAPQSCYSMPDYWGAAETFRYLSDFHFMKLLDFAAAYFDCFAAAPKPKKSADPLDGWAEAMLCGYLFQTYLTGWHKFCAEINMAPELLWKLLPGFETIKRADELSAHRPGKWPPGCAYVEEGAARYLARAKMGKPELDVDEETMEKFRPVTAEDIANNLRTFWHEMLAKWS